MSETSPESAKGFSLNLSRIPGRSLWRLGSVSSRSSRQTPSCFAAESNTTRAMVYEARLQGDAVETSALRPVGALHRTVCERTLSQRMRLLPYHNLRPTLGLVSF